MSSTANLDAYLRRINYAGSIAPTLETLSMVLQLHPAAIPFETLDPLLRRPVRLQLTDLEQKLVVERRGGCGIEHNLLLLAMLQSMDFAVTPLAATRLYAGRETEPTHVVLLVELAGVSWLADVGAPDVTPAGPLRLRADVDQQLPGGTFRLTGGHPRWQLDVREGADWRPVYELTLTPLGEEERVAINDRLGAAYADTLLVVRRDGAFGHRLVDTHLTSVTAAGETRRDIGTTIQIREALAELFGIALPAGEAIDLALENIVRKGRAG